MLSRSLSRPLLRLRSFVPSLLSSPSTSSQPDQNEHAPPPLLHRASFPGGAVRSSFFRERSRSFSSSGKGAGDGGGSWKFTQDGADDAHDLFGKPDEGDAAVAGLSGLGEHTGDGVAECRDPWRPEVHETKNADIFQHIDQEINSNKGSGSKDEWETVQGYKPWGFEEDEGKEEAFQFDVEQGGLEGLGDSGELENVKVEQLEQMEKEEQELLTKLKGPNRAFGDLIAASGITEEMIDSLILLKDLRGVQGLPPLREIEDMRLAKDAAPSARYEMERKKQEEVAKARVRQVDEKGRAYGTGKRKCSIARVWIQPGDGKFIVNDKQFDAYFPIIDHRADLLRPFTTTKTLGLFDVTCTVKGGGVSGQVGAVRLGISRALQNFEPGLRENLRSAGFLTRDSRVVERKKPGKAKARKSFQWVKR